MFLAYLFLSIFWCSLLLLHTLIILSQLIHQQRSIACRHSTVFRLQLARLPSWNAMFSSTGEAHLLVHCLLATRSKLQTKSCIMTAAAILSTDYKIMSTATAHAFAVSATNEEALEKRGKQQKKAGAAKAPTLQHCKRRVQGILPFTRPIISKSPWRERPKSRRRISEKPSSGARVHYRTCDDQTFGSLQYPCLLNRALLSY